MAHLFPNHHETSKRSEREDGKALEKVADRVAEFGKFGKLEDEPLRKFNGAVSF